MLNLEARSSIDFDFEDGGEGVDAADGVGGAGRGEEKGSEGAEGRASGRGKQAMGGEIAREGRRVGAEMDW